jgi:hypothetical protein
MGLTDRTVTFVVGLTSMLGGIFMTASFPHSILFSPELGKEHGSTLPPFQTGEIAATGFPAGAASHCSREAQVAEVREGGRPAPETFCLNHSTVAAQITSLKSAIFGHI